MPSDGWAREVRRAGATRRHLLVGVLLETILLLLARSAAGAAVISKSSLLKCARPDEETLQCTDKLVLTLAIDTGASLATETATFSVACVGGEAPGECPCPCDYAVDEGCTCRDLAESVSVSVSKGPVVAEYPLTYLQSFNAKPTEVVEVGDGNCKDGDYEEHPTCGFYYQDGQQVQDSQGFCCQCQASEIFDETFGDGTQRTRANLNCDYFDNFFFPLIGSPPSSAHCLYMNALWYEGYSIGESRMSFHVNVGVSLPAGRDVNSTTPGMTPPALEPREETLILSPSEPHKLSSGQIVAARLLGDLAAYEALPVLTNQMLFIAHPAGMPASQLLAHERDKWMAIDKIMVSLDGRACDKVGTSFSAFRYHPGRCERAVGTCLQNQLLDLKQEDELRVAQGQTPKYFVSRFSNGGPSELDASDGVVLRIPVTASRNSIVTLEARADDVRFVVNASPAEIVGAQVCKFANATCGSFEALSERGYMHVGVRNIGNLDSTYSVTASNCTRGVLAMPAKTVAVAARGERSVVFPVQMASSEAQNNTCWVAVMTELGTETDRRLVSFYTNATRFDEKPVSSTDFAAMSGANEEPLQLTCEQRCSSFFSVFCLLFNRCWAGLAKLALVVGGVILGILLLRVAVRRGWCGALLTCGCLPGKQDNKSKVRGKKAAQREFDEDDCPEPVGGLQGYSSALGGDASGTAGSENNFAMDEMLHPNPVYVDDGARTQRMDIPSGRQVMAIHEALIAPGVPVYFKYADWMAATGRQLPPTLLQPGQDPRLKGCLMWTYAPVGKQPVRSRGARSSPMDSSEALLCRFFIPTEWSVQTMGWNPRTARYQKLRRPRNLSSPLRLHDVPVSLALAMFSTRSEGVCLNP